MINSLKTQQQQDDEEKKRERDKEKHIKSNCTKREK